MAARVARVLKGGASTPWTPGQIAALIKADVVAVGRGCQALVRAGSVLIVGGSRRMGILYQWKSGAGEPGDKRGTHGKHKTGVAWVAARRQRQSLKHARNRLAAKRATAEAVEHAARGILGVVW
jgi:hypothetical protein